MLLIEDQETERLHRFDNIQFSSEEHKYFIRKNELISVTTFTHEYTPDFDAVGISEKNAYKEGISPRMLRDKWSVKSGLARVVGSEFHLYVEAFISYKKIIQPLLTPIQHRVQEFHKFYNEYMQYYDVIATELMVADEEWGIAGTLDCLARRKDNGQYVIFDWKTNEKFRYKNWYGSTLKDPLKHIPACEYYNYSFQLAMYKEIIRRNTGLDVRDTLVAYFPPADSYQVIGMYHMQPELQLIFGGTLCQI